MAMELVIFIFVLILLFLRVYPPNKKIFSKSWSCNYQFKPFSVIILKLICGIWNGGRRVPIFIYQNTNMDIKRLPKTEFAAAVAQIAGERNINSQEIIDAIEEGLISAYKRDQKEHGIIVPEEAILKLI